MLGKLPKCVSSSLCSLRSLIAEFPHGEMGKTKRRKSHLSAKEERKNEE
jgi:hypothetical protein